MAQPTALSVPSNLALRVRSAAVILPVAILAIWAGGVWFSLFVAAALVAMAWEWAGLCAPGQIAVVAATAILGLVILAIVSLGLYWPAVALGGLGAIVVAVSVRQQTMADRAIAGFGVIYLSAACAGAVWLRGLAGSGAMILLWLVLVIVATDIGAYAAGRSIGGPKLAPRISPKKTWAGLIGGAAAAAVVGVAGGRALPGIGGDAGRIAAIAVCLAVMAQLGDLLESHLKRRAGVKDSGSLIPGHGGVLDRLDGVLAAVPAFVAFILAGGAV